MKASGPKIRADQHVVEAVAVEVARRRGQGVAVRTGCRRRWGRSRSRCRRRASPALSGARVAPLSSPKDHEGGGRRCRSPWPEVMTSWIPSPLTSPDDTENPDPVEHHAAVEAEAVCRRSLEDRLDDCRGIDGSSRRAHRPSRPARCRRPTAGAPIDQVGEAVVVDVRHRRWRWPPSGWLPAPSMRNPLGPVRSPVESEAPKRIGAEHHEGRALGVRSARRADHDELAKPSLSKSPVERLGAEHVGGRSVADGGSPSGRWSAETSMTAEY